MIFALLSFKYWPTHIYLLLVRSTSDPKNLYETILSRVI